MKVDIEWAVGRRYFSAASMRELLPAPPFVAEIVDPYALLHHLIRHMSLILVITYG